MHNWFLKSLYTIQQKQTPIRINKNIPECNNVIFLIWGFTMVARKSYIFWDIMTSSLAKANVVWWRPTKIAQERITFSFRFVEKPNIKRAGRRQQLPLHSCFFFFGLLFDPEHEGYMFLWNVGLFSLEYMSLYSRR
jgi:hypothetical protein